MKVILSHDAFMKMQAYVNSSYPAGQSGTSLKEITGWGTVDQQEDGNLFVAELFLMKQEATTSHVEMDMDGWSRMVQELVEAGRDDVLARMNMWWHSHPFGSTTPPQFSTIDTDTMERFNLQDGFLLSIVASDKGAMRARYDQWKPVRMRLECEVIVERPVPSKAELDAVRNEVLEKVEFPAWKAPSYSRSSAPVGTAGWDWRREQITSGPSTKDRPWGLNRVNVPNPYEVGRFETKTDAEDEKAALERQMPGNKYEVEAVGEDDGGDRRTIAEETPYEVWLGEDDGSVISRNNKFLEDYGTLEEAEAEKARLEAMTGHPHYVRIQCQECYDYVDEITPITHMCARCEIAVDQEIERLHGAF